jgi:hypothetical protein
MNIIKTIGRTDVNELLKNTEETPSCVAINTLGFMKHLVKYPLSLSPWFKRGMVFGLNAHRMNYPKLMI